MRVKSILRTGILNILFQFGFLILMFAIGHKTSLASEGSSRFIILAGIVLVPSIIWTMFFYLQDRLEPEPVSYIITSFIAGMAAASLGAMPLYNVIFRVYEWIYASSVLFVLGSFFIMASVVSLLLYVVIRYGFYPLKEFDEPVDGMVYGAIAGAGFAFVKSLHYLWAHPSYTLFVIAYTATINILIYSGVGSLIGYVIGKSKFQRKNIDISSLIAVSVGILLLGIYHLVNEFIFVSGFDHAFWGSFILTMLYSLLILLFCYITMRKLTKEDYRRDIRSASKFDPFMAFFIVILLFVGGIIANQGLQGKKFVNTEYGVSFYYPHSLSPFSFMGVSQPLLSFNHEAKVLFSGESGSPIFSFSVKVLIKNTADTDQELMQYVEVSDAESLRVKDITIGGRRGKRIAYSYLDRQPDIEREFPQLIKVYTDIIALNEYVFIFTCKAPSEHFKDGLPQYAKILTSIRWKEA